MNYADYERDDAPPWLQGLWGQRWFYVSGLLKDAFVEATKQAVKARFVAFAPRDALGHLLRDFALDEPFNESEATTRTRIARAWDAWRRAGTKRGLTSVLNAAGYGDVDIKEYRDWNTTGRWWDFWVILKPPFPWDHALVRVATWGRGWRWGDGTRFATGFPEGERERVIALVRKWKPAHAFCASVLVVLRGRLWGDGFRFGDGTKWGGTVARWGV